MRSQECVRLLGTKSGTKGINFELQSRNLDEKGVAKNFLKGVLNHPFLICKGEEARRDSGIFDVPLPLVGGCLGRSLCTV